MYNVIYMIYNIIHNNKINITYSIYNISKFIYIKYINYKNLCDTIKAVLRGKFIH